MKTRTKPTRREEQETWETLIEQAVTNLDRRMLTLERTVLPALLAALKLRTSSKKR